MVSGDEKPVRALFVDPAAYDRWNNHWRVRLAPDEAAPEKRAEAMRRVNPAFIPRNHRVEEALSAAVEDSDYDPFDTLQKSCRVRLRTGRRLPPSPRRSRKAKSGIEPIEVPDSRCRATRKTLVDSEHNLGGKIADRLGTIRTDTHIRANSL